MRTVVLILSLLVTACASHKPITVSPVSTAGPPVTVESPVKAHLLDGSVVVFPEGVIVTRDSLRGMGGRYNLLLQPAGAVTAIPLDSVAAMETYPETFNTGRTVAYTAGVTVAAVVGTAALLLLIFGSCPTIYAVDGDALTLQAESFSYSVAPLFESRDVDVLHLPELAWGPLDLEVRNEALESHYLNHFEVLEARHASDERVVPDVWGHPVALRGLTAPEHVRDRAGRDVAAALSRHDGAVFQTDGGTLAAASADDLEDWLEFEVPAPAGADSVALVFRLRNSLLNTVLLYEVMLGAQGARALDWVGRDLARIGPAAELGSWYRARMGLRVAVWQDGAWLPVARVGDAGPIAWKDIAAVIPVPRGPAPEGKTLRVRLSFVADQWRIDQLAVAAEVRRPEVRALAVSEVVRPDGTSDAEALVSLRNADEEYLQTSPGQRMTLRFQPEPLDDADTRTFFLASQGYYIEWMRGPWLRSPPRAETFVPGDAALGEALARWRGRQEELETQFYASRIPVR